MPTTSEQIATSQQRQRIPGAWQVEFLDWTAEALLSLSKDAAAKKEFRSYAQWELDYRIAFEVEDPEMPRLQIRGDGQKLDELLTRRPSGEGAGQGR